MELHLLPMALMVSKYQHVSGIRGILSTFNKANEADLTKQLFSFLMA